MACYTAGGIGAIITNNVPTELYQPYGAYVAPIPTILVSLGKIFSFLHLIALAWGNLWKNHLQNSSATPIVASMFFGLMRMLFGF